MPIKRTLLCNRCGKQEDVSTEDDRGNELAEGWVQVSTICADCVNRHHRKPQEEASS